MHETVRLSFGTRSRFQPMRRNPDAYFPGYPAKVKLYYVSVRKLVAMLFDGSV